MEHWLQARPYPAVMDLINILMTVQEQIRAARFQHLVKSITQEK